MFPISFLTLALAFTSNVIALSLNVTSENFGRRAASLYTACTVPNTVAITFDDGPFNWLNDIVDQLDAAGAKGTFFFNGKNYDCIYNPSAKARVKYAYDHGHMIASHTWGHRDLATLTSGQVNDEMARTERKLAIERITGALVGFMRPPYRSYNQMVLDVSGNRGQRVVLWDFDARDGLGATPDESKRIYDDAIKRHPNTILTLNHETRETSIRGVLPYVIPKLQSAGYRLVTVAQCLGLPPYQRVGSPKVPDPSWTC